MDKAPGYDGGRAASVGSEPSALPSPLDEMNTRREAQEMIGYALERSMRHYPPSSRRMQAFNAAGDALQALDLCGAAALGQLVSVLRVRRILQERIGVCREAADMHRERATSLSPDDFQNRLAASETCAAMELGHVLRLLFPETGDGADHGTASTKADSGRPS